MLLYIIISQGTAGNDGPPGPPGERVSATQNALQLKTFYPIIASTAIVCGLKRSKRVLLQEVQWRLAQHVGVLQIRGLTTRLLFSSGSYYRFMKSSWALDHWKAVVQGSHQMKSDVALFISSMESGSCFFLYFSVVFSSLFIPFVSLNLKEFFEGCWLYLSCTSNVVIFY